jgi:2-haloacid dehalogenase
MELEAIVFDVIGTVVDEASIAEDLATVLEASVAPSVARRWEDAMNQRLIAIRHEEAPWRPSEAIRREALLDVLPGSERLSDEQLVWLDAACARLRPWPDSPAALRDLADRFKVVALSNASLAELAELSARGGLAWHAALSGELVKAYKPSAAVYELAIAGLGLKPARTLMVAAHPWDLRAAAGHGLRTAFVARPGAEPPRDGDRFDFQVDDLAALAALI